MLKDFNKYLSQNEVENIDLSKLSTENLNKLLRKHWKCLSNSQINEWKKKKEKMKLEKKLTKTKNDFEFFFISIEKRINDIDKSRMKRIISNMSEDFKMSATPVLQRKSLSHA